MHLGAGYFGGLCRIGKDTCDGPARRVSASKQSTHAGGGVRGGVAGLDSPTLCERHSRDLLSPANSPEGLPCPHLRGACLTFHGPPGSTGKGESWVPPESQKSYASVRRNLESLGLWSVRRETA